MTQRLPNPPSADCLTSGGVFESGQAEDGAALVQMAEHRAFQHAIVTLPPECDKQAFLAATSQALHFPHWFGHNWDAFADSLGDLSWMHADGYLIVIDGMAAFSRTDPHNAAIALEIFEQACDEWQTGGVPMCILLLETTAPSASRSMPVSGHATPDG